MVKGAKLARLGSAAVALTVFAVSFGASWFAFRGRPVDAPDFTVSPEAIARPGKQLVMVFVGSSRCTPSNAPEVLSSVPQLRELVRKRAQERGMGFVSIGVAREMSAAAGVQFLAQFGRFDEISAGQSALNEVSAHYISRDHVGIGATPQIIIVERDLMDIGGGVDPAHVSETVLLRKLGRLEIRRWAELGAPIPQSPGIREDAGRPRSVVPLGK